MSDPQGQDTREEQSAQPSRLRRFLERRLASRKRAVWALLGTLAGFDVVSWLFLEASGQVPRFSQSFASRLAEMPGDLAMQTLFAPFVMAHAIPALFYRGNLFHWNPGHFSAEVFPLIYWPVLVTAAVAFLWSRRVVWWLLLALILLATAPRVGQLILVGLLVT